MMNGLLVYAGIRYATIIARVQITPIKKILVPTNLPYSTPKGELAEKSDF